FSAPGVLRSCTAVGSLIAVLLKRSSRLRFCALCMVWKLKSSRSRVVPAKNISSVFRRSLGFVLIWFLIVVRLNSKPKKIMGRIVFIWTREVDLMGRTVVIPNSRRERNKKMWRILSASCVTLLGLVLLLSAPPVRAQELQVEFVQPPTSFLTADTGKEDGKIEPSGVATIGDGKFILVACDKNVCLSVVEASTGRIKQSFSVGVSDSRPKWEDLAHDDEGAYYVIGSRFVEETAEDGVEKKIIAVPRLLRFRLRSVDPGETPFAIDSESIVEWDIGDALAAEGYR